MALINTLNVTLVKSVIGRIKSHRATVIGLGLRRMHHTVTIEDTPATRGMINAVGYLLKVLPGESLVKNASSDVNAQSALPKKYLTKTGSDDLTVVEGIGPKIGELLIAGGITTFKQLSTTKQVKLESILKAAGSRYALANPSTWAEQAALLAAGNINAFEKLALELDGGVRK